MTRWFERARCAADIRRARLRRAWLLLIPLAWLLWRTSQPTLLRWLAQESIGHPGRWSLVATLAQSMPFDDGAQRLLLWHDRTPRAALLGLREDVLDPQEHALRARFTTYFDAALRPLGVLPHDVRVFELSDHDGDGRSEAFVLLPRAPRPGPRPRPQALLSVDLVALRSGARGCAVIGAVRVSYLRNERVWPAWQESESGQPATLALHTARFAALRSGAAACLPIGTMVVLAFDRPGGLMRVRHVVDPGCVSEMPLDGPLEVPAGAALEELLAGLWRR